HELVAMNGLRQQTVDAAALDLLGDERNPDEHGDEQPEERRRRQPQVLDDLDVLSCRQLPDQVRSADEQDGEQHEVVEHLVADRLAKPVDGDGDDRLRAEAWPDAGAHDARPRSTCMRSGVVTCWMKKSSSVSRIGLSDTRCAPAAVMSASRCSGGGASG